MKIKYEGLMGGVKVGIGGGVVKVLRGEEIEVSVSEAKLYLDKGFVVVKKEEKTTPVVKKRKVEMEVEK